MRKATLFRIERALFLAVILSFMVGCGGGGESENSGGTSEKATTQELALEKIAAYAEADSNTKPTLQDYIDAGVSGVTSENLEALNTIVSGLDADDVDSTVEIQDLTTQLGINIAPAANAGTDKTVEVNKSIVITGSGTDSDGSIASYQWKKGATVLASTASFSYSPTVVGTDTLSFTVTDNDGIETTDSMNVVVTAVPNSAPTSNAGTDKTVEVNKSIVITGSGTDGDGTIASYQWKKGTSVLASTASFSYIPTVVGTDTLSLTVTDNDGATAIDSVDVVVTALTDNTSNIPNILLIISDDQGQDASAQYDLSDDKPVTPNLNQLANSGIVFENAWATPACTTTRGAIITGQHGINSGIDTVPNRMSTDTNTLQRVLANDTATSGIKSAVFGKWHLGGSNADINHPNQSGISHYYGNVQGNLSDYELWDAVSNGEETTSMTYHTTEITNKAIDWISMQNSPWFTWVAYAAPHSPFHLPPSELHSRALSDDQADIDNNKRDYYLAAIEAMDHEIGRLINSLDQTTRDNTLIIFIGDNGSPSSVIDTSTYVKAQAKSTLFEGGIRVPLIVSGAKVERSGVREAALVNAVDIFSTVINATGASTPDNIDGESFYGLLSDSEASARSYNYSEFVSDDVTGWAVSNGQYKLIELSDGSQQLYDLNVNLREVNNLISSAGHGHDEIINALSNYADSIRNKNSDNEIKDITNVILQGSDANCTNYADQFNSNVVDVNNNTNFQGDLTISVENNECVFQTNLIPNHNFNDGTKSFPNEVQAVDDEYRVTTTPSFASSNSPLLLTQDNAIMLNGVKVDILAAGCFGVGNGKIGCNDINQAWRYDPLHQASGFSVDSHNAHTQPNGGYHYHGSPNALYDSSSASIVVGFAADGFPIYGGYISESDVIRKVTSSYKVKEGDRPNTAGSPGGSYDGTYRDDYEFVENEGDLDECNGMVVNGNYGYYITEEFPYLMACFKGTPNASFSK